MEKITLFEAGRKKEGIEHLKERLKSMILNKGIVWGSGLDQNNKVHRWIMDTKAFLLDPAGLHITAELFMDKIKKYDLDAVGGLTLASHLIASGLVYLSPDYGKKFDGFLVRREQKQHGMIKTIEGPDIQGKNLVIVDDGLNAAGFALKAIEAVESIGCRVLAVIVLINFEKDDFIELKNRGYTVESIFTLKDLGLDTKHVPINPDMFELKWRYGLVNASDYKAPKSSPVIADDKIYIGSDRAKMLCLDFSGKLLWEFKTDFNPHGVHQTPIIVKDKVIFAGYDGSIYAVNKENGSLLWKNKASSFNGATAIYDKDTDLVYIGLENSTLKGTMAALNAEDGNIVWEFTTNHHVPGRPAIKGNILVFGSNDCFIYAIDKQNGNLLWKFRTHGENKGRLTIDNNLAYATSFDGFLYCLELPTGDLVWKKKLGKMLYNEPIICDNKVIVGSFSNQLTALDKKSGKVLWCFMTNGPIQSYPSYLDGAVYVGSYDGNIYAVDGENGKLIWTFITGGIINSAPAIYKDRLLVSSFDGYLYCFEKKIIK